MIKSHTYQLDIIWTGNNGPGTTDYAAYRRDYTLQCNNKPDMHCSADTPFRGDPNKYNPEDMFLSSLSSCHMLWYLHLCADAGIIVTEYRDHATGLMTESYNGGGGKFLEILLSPKETVADASMVDKAYELHNAARDRCFIANSCNFTVMHHPECRSFNI